MANRHRGEIDAVLDGESYRLCLTLGALAELEDAFSEGDMLALAERFGKGRLSARDAVRIIGAGLRGAGRDIADKDVARMRTDNGAAGFVDIVARLLAVTFGAADGAPALPASAHASPRPAVPDDQPRSVMAAPEVDTEARQRVPFPGRR